MILLSLVGGRGECNDESAKTRGDEEMEGCTCRQDEHTEGRERIITFKDDSSMMTG